MSSAFSLKFYQALSTIRYPTIAAGSRALDFPVQLGPKATEVSRPAGPLVWLHVLDDTVLESAWDFLRAAVTVDGVSVLLTSNQEFGSAETQRLSDVGILYQCLGRDDVRTARRFLGAWKPSLGIFLGRDLMPKLLFETKLRGVRMILANAAPDIGPRIRHNSQVRFSSRLLDCFDEIIPTSHAARNQFQKFGVQSAKMRTLGSLQEVADASSLDYVPSERTHIARQLGGRTTWLASQVYKEEVSAILAAHRAAERSAPRLLLILEPRSQDDVPAILKEVEAMGSRVSLRSKEGGPDADSSVFIADEPGELGLWYRLASVSFIGGTFTFGQVENPFFAAALGSAVIHGPHYGDYGDAFARLANGHAACKVERVDELTQKLIETIAPDRAAKLAHAAWEISFAGAEAQDRLIEIVNDLPTEAI